MGFERVLLITPNPKAEWQGIMPHLGQGYLAQTLLENGIEYDVLDMNLGYGPKHVRRRVEGFRPDLVGISLISFEYKRFYSLLEAIRTWRPSVKTVVGGPHVTIMRERVLKECSAVDYGVVFEGETTLAELCRSDSPVDKIKGLMYRSDGEVVYSGDREILTDLDKISWPRYEKFELPRYVRERVIYSSRGCPHQCIFCPNRIISPHYRPRSAQHVVDEMEHWYRRGIRQFNFDDDNFNLIEERVYQICDEIERRGLERLFLRCSNGIRADRVDRRMLARMREVGFRYIAFGADAGNNRMLQVVKKGETIEQIESAVAAACDLGYDVKILFVVGTPYETWEDVEDKVRLAQRHPIQEVHFYNTIPMPGTELFDWVKENNLFLIDPEVYLNEATGLSRPLLFETPELPKDERVRLFKYLRKVRGRVHREAMLRTLQRLPLLGPLARNRMVGILLGHVLLNRFVEKYFYQSAFVRRTIERFRYSMAVRQ
jgi:anaerobic magnesium-protoporphyrin IX monomethyl ester cyclase